jgi:hypothetical protein
MSARALPKAFLSAAACALALALAVSCTSKPPVISRVYARVIYTQDPSTGVRSESLGVYLVATDPDGIENLDAFYVINDDAELFWKVDKASWVSAIAEGETWIGTASLAMPGSAPLPAGEYRVVLEAAGGETDESTFTVSARPVPAAGAGYPSAKVEEGAIKVAGSTLPTEVWVYGKDDAFASAYPAGTAARPLLLKTIAASSPALADGFTFRVFVWNELDGYGMLVGPLKSGSLSGP